jgi:hypothetical protein
LPNLYHLDGEQPKRPRYSGGTLRIGAFGAMRVLKNLMTAAGATLQIANAKRAELEFWISAGRSEGAGWVIEAVRQMLNGLPHVKLVENNWQTWPRFRQTVRHMHLMLQPSYTESFNVVTADGVAQGVPGVVSDAIDWAPDSWKAPVDDANAVGARWPQAPRKRVGRGARIIRPETSQQPRDASLVGLPQLTCGPRTLACRAPTHRGACHLK